MGLICCCLLAIHITYSTFGYVNVDFYVQYGIIDSAVILQMVVALPVLFWLMFVTYSTNSIIVKYLTKQVQLELAKQEAKVVELKENNTTEEKAVESA